MTKKEIKKGESWRRGFMAGEKEAREKTIEKAKATIRLWRPVFYRKELFEVSEVDLQQLFKDLDELKN